MQPTLNTVERCHVAGSKGNFHRYAVIIIVIKQRSCIEPGILVVRAVRLPAGGTTAILFQLTLGSLVVAYTPVVPWIIGVFLLGLPLAIGVTRSRRSLFMPAVAIMTLTGVSPVFVVDAPVWGRTVNLRLVDDIPAGIGVAGYIAPRWRVAAEFAGEARLSGGRGSKSYGTRRLAPLVGENWRPELPVEVWVAGEVRDSGRVLASHPQFWRNPAVSMSGSSALPYPARRSLRAIRPPNSASRRWRNLSS